MPALKPFDKDTIKFNAGKILSSAGSPRKLVELIEQTGLPAPALDLIYVWQSRNRIPAHWLPVLVYTVIRHKLLTTGELFARKETVDAVIGD